MWFSPTQQTHYIPHLLEQFLFDQASWKPTFAWSILIFSRDFSSLRQMTSNLKSFQILRRQRIQYSKRIRKKSCLKLIEAISLYQHCISLVIDLFPKCSEYCIKYLIWICMERATHMSRIYLAKSSWSTFFYLISLWSKEYQ